MKELDALREMIVYAVYEENNSSFVSMPDPTEKGKFVKVWEIREVTKRTQLFPNWFELIQICFVLILVLDLLLNALKNSHRSGVVVHTARRSERGLDNGGCRHEVMRKAVIQSALDLKEVFCRLEEVDVALRE
jgi:hypothetical protein